MEDFGLYSDIIRRLVFGNYTFIQAIKKNETDNVKLFLDAGIDPDVEYGRKNKSAITFAVSNGYADIVSLIAEHGADVIAENKRDSTLLHLASEKGRVDIILILILSGRSLCLSIESRRLSEAGDIFLGLFVGRYSVTIDREG